MRFDLQSHFDYNRWWCVCALRPCHELAYKYQSVSPTPTPTPTATPTSIAKPNAKQSSDRVSSGFPRKSKPRNAESAGLASCCNWTSVRLAPLPKPAKLVRQTNERTLNASPPPPPWAVTPPPSLVFLFLRLPLLWWQLFWCPLITATAGYADFTRDWWEPRAGPKRNQ